MLARRGFLRLLGLAPIAAPAALAAASRSSASALPVQMWPGVLGADIRAGTFELATFEPASAGIGLIGVPRVTPTLRDLSKAITSVDLPGLIAAPSPEASDEVPVPETPETQP